ncbi:MAG: class I SAM-dependent methyltransferase [Pseudomonadota bacterium]
MTPMTNAKRVALTGVPETMLWPLWQRANETKRRDRLIEDAWSARLVGEIEYDFRGTFGRPNRGHGIRARYGDDLIKSFLDRIGDKACIIALGEGLETAYWRLGEPNIPWFSVDVPEAIETRKQMLPDGATTHALAYSALDHRWMDAIPEGRIAFISAAGLLMYFEEQNVRDLFTKIGQRFAGAELYFDAIPPIFSKRTVKGMKVTKAYTAPPMPWGISTDDIAPFLTSIPNIEPIKIQTYAQPFPHAMRPYNWLSKIGFIRRALAPSLVHARVVD